jgi:Ser/Thr protein kinase RdoA (MazF antagonist)
MSALIETLCRRATEALGHWDLPDQTPELLKYRENAVFKVRLADGGKAALRLHRPGYHSETALLSELQWMADLRANGLNVPLPLATTDGRLLVTLGLQSGERQYADLIDWVDGQQIGETGKPFAYAPDELASTFAAVGTAMAEMHNAADRWVPPAGFLRHAWDADGLLGEQPFWGRFWDCASLSHADRAFLAELRERLMERLATSSRDLDYGLIHADLVRENVLLSEGRVALIDFDDCGFGWRLFDLATALLRNRSEPHYPLIRQSLLDGYRSKRPLGETALAHLPLFLLLRSLTYIGWIGARPELADSAERMARYVNEARMLSMDLEKS